MCQLLGMNCNVPTDIVFSFTGFAHRGGRTDEHKDGWGIAFFEGAGVRLFVDHESAVASPVAELIKSYPIKSKNVIAHIRKATQGISCSNCEVASGIHHRHKKRYKKKSINSRAKSLALVFST
jgi:predicted glutamine amidotransferase